MLFRSSTVTTEVLLDDQVTASFSTSYSLSGYVNSAVIFAGTPTYAVKFFCISIEVASNPIGMNMNPFSAANVSA